MCRFFKARSVFRQSQCPMQHTSGAFTSREGKNYVIAKKGTKVMPHSGDLNNTNESHRSVLSPCEAPGTNHFQVHSVYIQNEGTCA